MKRAVLIHHLSPTEPTKIYVPYGSVIRHVTTDANDQVSVYIEQTVSPNPPGPTYLMEIIVVGTSEAREDLLDWEFAQSVLGLARRAWHVYYRQRALPEDEVPVPLSLVRET